MVIVPNIIINNERDNMFKQLFKSMFPKKKFRKELALVTYAEAEHLLKDGWIIAREEDDNHALGCVYLELLEDNK